VLRSDSVIVLQISCVGRNRRRTKPSRPLADPGEPAGVAGSSRGIEVSLVQPAEGTVTGAVSVSVSQDIAASGQGFSFAVPMELSIRIGEQRWTMTIGQR